MCRSRGGDPASTTAKSIVMDLLQIDYHEDGRSHEPFQNLRFSQLPFIEVLERLRRAIAAEQLLLLHEIDPQAILTLVSKLSMLPGSGRSSSACRPQ
jgi:hypothetical protein